MLFVETAELQCVLVVRWLDMIKARIRYSHEDTEIMILTITAENMANLKFQADNVIIYLQETSNSMDYTYEIL